MADPAFASSLFRSSNSANNRVRFSGAVPGLQVGDGLLCVIMKKNAASPITPPSGYVNHIDNGSSYVGAKVADAGDVAATIHDFIFASGLSSEQGILMRITDVDSPNFVDNVSVIGSAATPITCPPLTASRKALFIIFGVGSSSFNRTGGTHTGPAGFTERHDHMSFEISLGLYTKDTIVTSIGPELITPSPSANVLTQGGAIAVVAPLLPGSGGIMGDPSSVAKKPITKAEVLAAREHAKATGAKVKTKFDQRRR